jgi:hypothetical protein
MWGFSWRCEWGFALVGGGCAHVFGLFVLQLDDVPGALVLQPLQAHSSLVLHLVHLLSTHQA